MAVFSSSGVSFHYWPVEAGKLIAGRSPVGYESFECKAYLKHLLDMGVRTFISLQEEDEVARKPFPYYHDALDRLAEEQGVTVTFIRMPIMDGTVINDESLIHVLDIIDSANRRDQAVYVHCLAGHGRTGTVVGCWLVRHGMTGEEALQKITELRRHDDYLRQKKCPQKPQQVYKVHQWEEDYPPKISYKYEVPHRYYYARTDFQMDKSEAIPIKREKIIERFKEAFCSPLRTGPFYIVDQHGSEVVLMQAWVPWEEGEQPPDDPLIEVEVPFFYEGRKNNVTFIETVRAWGKKPIRVFKREVRLSELDDIIQALPDVFFQDCIPGCTLGRSGCYRD